MVHLPQIYWAWRLWRYIGNASNRRNFLRLSCVALLLVLQIPWFNLFFGRSTAGFTLPDMLQGPYRILSATWALGAIAALLWLVARRCGRLVWTRVHGASQELDPARRRLLGVATAGLGLAPWLIVGYGVVSARLRHQIVESTVSVSNLPNAFDGFRIVQLTDIHVSEDMPPALIDSFVDLASAQEADLGIFTGDYLAFDQWGLEECVSVLSQLQTRHGILGCLGNHELHTEASDRITSEFDRRGVDILRNEARDFNLDGSRLRIVGVDYQRSRRLPLRHVHRLLRHQTSNLLLSHNPNVFPNAAENGVALTLAGHTHGGQVRLEILEKEFAPGRFVSPYVQGLYQLGTSKLYVSRGIGTIGLPIRIGAPPEITVITLRRG